MKSKKPGQANAHKLSDLGALTNVNISNQAATNSKFSFDYSIMERDNNVINDIFIDNSLIMTLKQETSDNLVISLKIEPHIEAIENKILEFIDSHNELIDFIYYQKEKNHDESYKDSAILGPIKEFHIIADEIKRLIENNVFGLSDKSSIMDIGFTKILELGDSQNSPVYKITFKDNKNKEFISNIEQNINQVRSIFEFSFASNNPSAVKLYSRNGIYNLNNFILDIDVSRPNIIIGEVTLQDKARAIIDGVNYRVNFEDKDKNGNQKLAPIIRGLAGTPIADLELLYFGSGQDVVEVTISQGIADIIYTKINQFIKTSNILMPMNSFDIAEEGKTKGLTEEEIAAEIAKNIDGYYYDLYGNMKLINKEQLSLIEKIKRDYIEEKQQKEESIEYMKQNLMEREQFFLETCSRSKMLVEEANRQIDRIQAIDKAKYSN